jgi:hypothetical protein
MYDAVLAFGSVGLVILGAIAIVCVIEHRLVRRRDE